MENLEKIPNIILFLMAFKMILQIGIIIFFPWIIAYLYRKMNYIPWSVWEKNPNTKIYNQNIACESDFKKNVKIL